MESIRSAARMAKQLVKDALPHGMIPGEVKVDHGIVQVNEGVETVTVVVANTGDRSVQVGSHYHFYEVNRALEFDRAKTRGFRLNLPAGASIRFEPGQTQPVDLVAYRGARVVQGFHGEINGPLEEAHRAQ